MGVMKKDALAEERQSLTTQRVLDTIYAVICRRSTQLTLLTSLHDRIKPHQNVYIRIPNVSSIMGQMLSFLEFRGDALRYRRGPDASDA